MLFDDVIVYVMFELRKIINLWFLRFVIYCILKYLVVCKLSYNFWNICVIIVFWKSSVGFVCSYLVEGKLLGV